MHIITALQCISLEVTVKGFTNSCVFSAVDKTDNDVLWNESEEDGEVLS